MSEPQVEGFVRFNITISPMEMRDWHPRVITDFFNGLAQVVYAAGKNAIVEVVSGATSESTT